MQNMVMVTTTPRLTACRQMLLNQIAQQALLKRLNYRSILQVLDYTLVIVMLSRQYQRDEPEISAC